VRLQQAAGSAALAAAWSCQRKPGDVPGGPADWWRHPGVVRPRSARWSWRWMRRHRLSARNEAEEPKMTPSTPTAVTATGRPATDLAGPDWPATCLEGLSG